MGQVVKFDGTHAKRGPASLPVALLQAGAVYWAECSAAWWRWVFTGR